MYIFGEIGFSYVGLIYLLMLFIPNTLWAVKKPIGYDALRENKILLIIERIGQVLCTTFVLIFKNFNINKPTPWHTWLAVSFLLMILYDICWVRYFKSPRRAEDFYRRFAKIPVPLASLPVMAFFMLGIYGRVAVMSISAALLGIGHIGIHLSAAKQL